MNKYLIHGKGYFNVTTNDPFISGIEISDIKSSYGYIKFTGTEKQLDKFCDYLLEQGEATFKITGIFNEEEETHYKQLLNK